MQTWGTNPCRFAPDAVPVPSFGQRTRTQTGDWMRMAELPTALCKHLRSRCRSSPTQAGSPWHSRYPWAMPPRGATRKPCFPLQCLMLL